LVLVPLVKGGKAGTGDEDREGVGGGTGEGDEECGR
jgi:hypothetical protein